MEVVSSPEASYSIRTDQYTTQNVHSGSNDQIRQSVLSHKAAQNINSISL